MVPSKQHNDTGQDRHQQHGRYGHGPMEGDGSGTEQAQVYGGALEGQTWAAHLEEAVVP